MGISSYSCETFTSSSCHELQYQHGCDCRGCARCESIEDMAGPYGPDGKPFRPFLKEGVPATVFNAAARPDGGVSAPAASHATLAAAVSGAAALAGCALAALFARRRRRAAAAAPDAGDGDASALSRQAMGQSVSEMSQTTTVPSKQDYRQHIDV